MIDPSFDDPALGTLMEVPTYAEMKAKVDDLENKLSLKTQQWEYASDQVRKYAAQVDAFEQELKNNSWDFDSETLADLASYFDITLEREYMVYVTVRFSGNVSVPMDYDIDDLENELSAELSKGYYSNSSVEVDFMEEEMEISYEEM